MFERKVKVETFMVYAQCPCGGEFKPTGEAMMSYPPKYVHVCDKCGRDEVFRDNYPKIVHEQVKQTWN